MASSPSWFSISLLFPTPEVGPPAKAFQSRFNICVSALSAQRGRPNQKRKTRPQECLFDGGIMTKVCYIKEGSTHIAIILYANQQSLPTSFPIYTTSNQLPWWGEQQQEDKNNCIFSNSPWCQPCNLIAMWRKKCSLNGMDARCLVSCVHSVAGVGRV